MESSRLSLLFVTLLLGAACAAPLAAEEPARHPIETPPLLLETGAPVSAQKGEPPTQLPVWVEDPSLVVEKAFDLKREEGTPPPFVSGSATYDVGELFSSVASTSDTAPAPPTTFATQLAQLERAAGEASNTYSLGRLAEAAQMLSLRPALSEEERTRAEKIASWALAARGRRLAADGQRNRALQDFDRAVRLSPQSTTARLDRAISLAERGESELALRDFDKVIALAPEWLVARRNRASILFGMGEDERALKDCDKALQSLSGQKPDTSLGELYTLRGRILHRLGRHGEAIADFDQALRLRLGDSTLHWLRGNVFAEIGFFEQAINDYLTALRADPAMAQAYRSLSWVLATCPEKRLRNPATAIEAAWRARRLGAPGDPRMLDASAAAHASAGDFNEAIRLQQRALVAASSGSASHLRERLLLYRSGQSYVAPVFASLESPANQGKVVPTAHTSPRVRPPVLAR